jgi:S-adenosylmethionine:tRNA ribosyltransferase-isomerase
MQVHNIRIKDYTYFLPEDKIAVFPLPERHNSRLLIYDGQISESTYLKIADSIPSPTLMVFNDTKVVAARLLFEKATGGQIEIFCLEPSETALTPEAAMLHQTCTEWTCLVGGAKKWKGSTLKKKIFCHGNFITLTAEKIRKEGDCFTIRFSWTEPKLSFAAILHEAGLIPLPPYLHRETIEQDALTYQTVFAKTEGSVAAPTAGLHFSNQVLTSLQEKKITTSFITLHVGAGTFKPVKSETIKDHEMHSEWINVPLDFVGSIKDFTGPIVAVGTTVCRTLETLYHIGSKLYRRRVKNEQPVKTDWQINQWDPYLPEANLPTVHDALQTLYEQMKADRMNKLVVPTQILILPGYCFKVVAGLVTNFHQPASTLLLLIAAFVGDDWKKMYDYALAHDFRFLSYGDGSLLWKKK